MTKDQAIKILEEQIESTDEEKHEALCFLYTRHRKDIPEMIEHTDPYSYQIFCTHCGKVVACNVAHGWTERRPSEWICPQCLETAEAIEGRR